MKIKFIEVGRDKKTWTAEFKGKKENIKDWILGQASKALISNNIGFYIDENGKGNIFAGLYTVGKMEVLKEIRQSV